MTNTTNAGGDDDLAARLLAEGLRSPSALAREVAAVGRMGRPVHPATVCRWMHDGVRLPDGSRVRLESVRLGGKPMSSVAALVRFIAAQQVGHDQPAPAGARTRRATAARAAAGRELERLGA